MSIQNGTSAGVRASVTAEDDDDKQQAAAPREEDDDTATVTGSVKSAIGGECNTMRDGICRD
jgi:hypothetical protein